ncbi:TMV resistance protein N-like [Neltuma alba]|uniref:TMV resistance protein N-like n=1 Tax=Neltuma alba TaxID=207710 RepID=UPI0010A31AF0|nr:TMV resistance protein N-like [Prosopis alba]
MGLIKRKLTDKKILLVLDDVSDIRQLENLAPKQGWFSEGSIIIITTRDRHLLSSHGVSAVYEFKLLSDNESLELFLEKAFKEEHPNEDYLKLARTVIKYAGGLPLVLTVLGSSLCKRTIVEWKDELAKFKKVPPKDILKILQVSFDGLDDQEKTIFLDIACFFNGMDKDHVIQILETLEKDLHPETGINVLIKRSLITNYEGHLWVHEILQDMGKYIVYQESPYDAGKRSRIPLPSLKSLDLSHSKYLIKTPNFDGIPHLEKLILEGCSNLVKIHQSLGQHKKLVIVDLKDCKEVKTLPKKFEINGLETFILSGCSKVRKLPEFGKDMTHLSKLDLEKTGIAKLPQSLGNLIGLIELNLRNCKKLVCLPCSVNKLKALKVIKISECSKFSRLPENLNENEALEELDLSGIAIKGLSFSDCNDEAQFSSSWSCFSLLQRPSSSTNFMLLPSLSSLTHLRLVNCNLHDASLPDDISMLSSLEILDLSGNNFIDLPSGLISNLSKLKECNGNKSPRMKISKCGWRAVCKEDVEAWRRTGDEGCSIINNYVKIDPDINSGGYSPRPRPDDTVVEVDGAYSHLDDKAACGGVLKDGNNCMKEAFLLKLSGGDILTAKLWGCLMGLKSAWDAGTGDVILRSDSAEAVRLIKFEVPETHKDIALIMEIKGMLEWDWFVDIQVFHRDGNGIAELLAKRALNGAMGLQILGPRQ